MIAPAPVESAFSNPAYESLKANGQRLNETLEYSCQWGATPDGGMNRLSGNDDDRQVRDWFVNEVRRYGCTTVKVDAMGNTFAVRPGLNNDLPPIALGSHLDTQPTGGKYDGILGVLCALEVLRVVHEAGVTTYAPLAVVNWTNEEGARFPPAMLGSGVWCGEFTTEWAHSRPSNPDATTTMKQELERIGYLGDVACSHEANPLLAHFEVHIEQGPILDAAEKPVGIVKGAQAIRWYKLAVRGREAHTGSTPMDRRCDALLAAAEMIVHVNRVATTTEHLASRGARGTIAVINSSPQSVNTIAGQVTMNLDLRSPHDEDLEELERLCREGFEAICKKHGATVDMDCFWKSPATNFHPEMVECVRQSAKTVGCTHEIISGAGHDR
jgi:hydantoinase/carbamoylase family amidase